MPTLNIGVKGEPQLEADFPYTGNSVEDFLDEVAFLLHAQQNAGFLANGDTC